eukprot:GHVO01065744.1.p1 GENE.GHVO01065744.1~~GHVO01065744.1.p1  ORF type:complete len:148 (+),score=25.21 GHVO01065744.1:31-444(+)
MKKPAPPATVPIWGFLACSLLKTSDNTNIEHAMPAEASTDACGFDCSNGALEVFATAEGTTAATTAATTDSKDTSKESYWIVNLVRENPVMSVLVSVAVILGVTGVVMMYVGYDSSLTPTPKFKGSKGSSKHRKHHC